MPISVNEGGQVFELDIITVNEGGELFELDNIHSNEGGVLNEIFSAWSVPDGVLWDDGTLENSHQATKAYSEKTVGTFTLKTKAKVNMTGSFALDSSGLTGSGTASLVSGSIDSPSEVIFSKRLDPGDNFNYTGELPRGEYAIVINGGGGSESGNCGYRTTCTLTFIKP